MHDAMPTGIWPHNLLLPRQGNGHTRHALSIQSPARPRPSIGYCYPSSPHNTKLQRSFPASLHQWSRNACPCWPHRYWLAQTHQGSSLSPPPILATQRDSHHTGWSGPVRWSTCHSSHQKGEGPASTASIPLRNKEVTVACTWKFLLDSINKAIEEAVCQCETCIWFQSQHATMPLTPMPTPSCPWQTCGTDIFTLEGVYYLGSWWFLLEDDLHSMSSIWPEQCQQGCLTAERDIVRAWHPWSPSLWQWPTICECPVCQLLYILGHNTQNLKSTLPTIQQICWGMCQVHQTCTPMSQVQWCRSTARLASTPSYTHQHQASIPSRAVVPMPTQNNHSGQDLQQWPIIHTSLWADWHMLQSCQITGWQMQQNTCATVCWSTSCNIWHPQKDLGSCYCDVCPTMEQLSSTHQQWFHTLLHVETPSWMQCQSSQHCPKRHNCHTAGSD